MFRVLEKLGWGCFFHHTSLGHQYHPIGNLFGKFDFMGHYHHGDVLLSQLSHHIQHLPDHLWIQGAGGFIKQEDPGLHA